jgi:nitrite reductase/ring-hydroxylating ferredoxin subunit
MSRSAVEWNQPPTVEHVDSRIYTDEAIFEQELARIWKKAWIVACHESELPEAYDFRTLTIAREPVVVCRGEDERVRAFLNVCPHRGNLIVRSPAGSFKIGDPSGNPKRMTCMFHGWQFDSVYTVDVSKDGKSADAVSWVSIYVTMLDGANAPLDSGETRLFCVGKYHDRLDLAGEQPLLKARNLRLDTRRLDRGSHAVL